VLLSLKLPSIYPAIDEHLGEGDSVVVQLVSTAESILNRRLDELEPAEREALDIAYDCKEYVVDYLTRAFPTRQMEEYKSTNSAMFARGRCGTRRAIRSTTRRPRRLAPS
jgi:hypothetical protein